MRWEVRLAGFGGQGIVLAGYVLGKAAALYDGKDAILSQSYGPEARGGACSAELVISDEEIDYPMIARPNVVVLMSQEAFHRYGPAVREGGVVLMDSDLVQTDTEGGRVYRVPATRLAEELGNRIAANMVMLGFFSAVTSLVSREALEESIRTSVRERTVPLNLKAFAAGYEYAAKVEAGV
ncbi:MAG: 2-oxoacid:acceptor oxidoreductase family protein [Dehalococcoidia bacterium]